MAVRTFTILTGTSMIESVIAASTGGPHQYDQLHLRQGALLTAPVSRPIRREAIAAAMG